ncbi:RidA family protein [Brevibacterium daeguense]|uniref:RidA family protein n=1 Tax=Brevibacterium daeguense TaxID=909936 RepID=A0ABP8EFI4_9MICO
MITYADHPSLPEPRGYHHAARAQGPFIFTAGQTWSSPEGAESSEADAGLLAQVQSSVSNAIAALEGAGGGATGVVSLELFVVGLTPESVNDVYRGIGRASRDLGFGDVPITVLGVAALAISGALAETRAIGVPIER